MAILDVFSKRNRVISDVYVYDAMPTALRVQLVQIVEDAIGPNSNYHGYGKDQKELYEIIHSMLAREFGTFRLTEHSTSHFEHLANFILQSSNIDRVIDTIEFCLRMIDRVVRDRAISHYRERKVEPDDAIKEANYRFKEHGVGYEYNSGTIIRIDSQLIHSEMVKPAIFLLKDARYAGANQEFLNAHEHFRHARYKECITESLKAFESTMKAVCEIKKYPYNSTDTAKDLIKTCIDNSLFPTFLQTHIGNLRSILESGLPTVRNKQSGHGQGSQVVEVSQTTASFALHTAATNIVFFVEAAK